MLRRLVAALALLVVALVPILSGPARQAEAVLNWPVLDCQNASPNGLGQATIGSSAYIRTLNDTTLVCYYVYLSGYFRDASSNYETYNGSWVGGYPAWVMAGWHSSLIGTPVEASGLHNLCRTSGWTLCNSGGYESSLAY